MKNRAYFTTHKTDNPMDAHSPLPAPAKHLQHYLLQLQRTGNTGTGTSNYTAYERSCQWSGKGKPVIEGSSDPDFRGDPAKYNPEELLLAALSSCHMHWFLHRCAEAAIPVPEYRDEPAGSMTDESHPLHKAGQSMITPGILHRLR